MQEEMPGDRAEESVIFAVVTGPLRRCNTFLPFPHLLPTFFYSQSYLEGCDGGYLTATTLVEV